MWALLIFVDHVSTFAWFPVIFVDSRCFPLTFIRFRSSVDFRLFPSFFIYLLSFLCFSRFADVLVCSLMLVDVDCCCQLPFEQNMKCSHSGVFNTWSACPDNGKRLGAQRTAAESCESLTPVALLERSENGTGAYNFAC